MTMKEVNAQEWLDGIPIPNKGIIKSMGRNQAGVENKEF